MSRINSRVDVTILRSICSMWGSNMIQNTIRKRNDTNRIQPISTGQTRGRPVTLNWSQIASDRPTWTEVDDSAAGEWKRRSARGDSAAGMQHPSAAHPSASAVTLHGVGLRRKNCFSDTDRHKLNSLRLLAQPLNTSQRTVVLLHRRLGKFSQELLPSFVSQYNLL